MLISLCTPSSSRIPSSIIDDNNSSAVNGRGNLSVSVVTAVTVLAGVVLLTVTAVTAVTDLEGEHSAFRVVSSVGVLYPFIK